MGKKITKSLPWIVVALVTFATYGASIGMASTLLTPWWIPAASSVALAVAAGWWTAPLWGKLTGSSSKIVNGLCNAAIGTGVMLAVILGLNLAGGGEPTVEQVPVVSSYTTTEHHTRRLRRGVYVQGSAYTQYHVTLKLPGDKVKSVIVSRERYNRLRRSRRAEVALRHGLLGMDYFTIR